MEVVAMPAIRCPAVAGTFYPDDSKLLKKMVGEFLAAAHCNAAPPKAIIAPHAGYIYSGAIAASAYSQVANGKDRISRVILLGPSHRVPFHGMATTTAQRFSTPLGEVTVDTASLEEISHLPQVLILDEAHQWEHCLEVQLPFLQLILGDFKIVPLVVGDASADEVGEVLDILWGGDETLIVVSSDLSHYHDYDTACRLDRRTSEAITHFRPLDIHYEDACGRNPILGLLAAASRHGLHAEVLDLRNSGDTAGPRDQVVGYGAYVFH